LGATQLDETSMALASRTSSKLKRRLTAGLVTAISVLALGGSIVRAAPEWAGYGDPSAEEQQFLDLLNAARADPEGTQRRLGVDLTADGSFKLVPRPPLVMNAHLTGAARAHSRAMNDHDFFDHVNLQGQGPGARIRQAGYQWRAYSENLCAGDTSPAAALDRMLIDKEDASLKHRISLLGLTEQTALLTEIGVGIHTGKGRWKHYYVLDLATKADGTSFITGTVFRDGNGNGRCEPGEGVPGARIELGAGGPSTTTGRAGGYGIPAPEPGRVVLTAALPALEHPLSTPVRVDSTNLKVDFVLPGPGGRPAPRIARAGGE
jgi:uncharacterized protein YkwD